MSNKKSKKSIKPLQKHLVFGVPTNIAAGLLGFRAELDTNLQGESHPSYHDLKADCPDSTAVLDEKNPRPSRIIFYDKSEDQGHPVPGTSTSAVVVGGAEPGNDPTGE